MKKYCKLFAPVTLAALLLASDTITAGNPDRAGQAGATQLLINPWAATGGTFGMNGASVCGLEAMKLNIAGLAKTKGFECGVVHNTYLP